MFMNASSFLRDESAAVTVDWTVLSAAAVGMALSTVAVLEGGIENLTGRLDAELRDQQMSDAFVQYTAEHFEQLFMFDLVSPDDAPTYFGDANQLMNNEILDELRSGIAAMEDGTITQDELIELVAVASVAYQRNLVDDEVMAYYFGFGVGDAAAQYTPTM